MKTSNFKKVLALVIAFAMVLSVCTMSFSVSAETADLSYYVFNDGTVDGAWTNGSSQRTVALGNDAVLRIAPQRTGKSHVNVTLEKGDLTADDFATVNTLSYYVKNETDAPLTLRYQYYLGNGSAGYFNGWVYLVAADEAEILPYKADKDGNITLPAKFEGYVVYDLSKSDNYGNVALNTGAGEDGNPVWDSTNTVVDYIKAQSFSNMVMFYTATDKMLTKAFYLDDVAVSTKTVEELAKFLTNSKTASWNFNTASAGGYAKDDAINFWGVSLEKWDLNNENGPANLVDFGNLDGIGSQFPRIAAGGYHDGALGLNNAFVESIGTDLPYALENAKAIKVSVENKGNITLGFRVAGSGNYLFGSFISVADDGTVTTSAKFPTNFSGDTYFIFDDMAVSTGYSNTPTYTWADFIKSRTGDFNMNAQIAGGAAGDVITVGGFSFVYDLTEITALTKNPVFIDGTAHYKGWFAPDGGAKTAYRGTQWGRFTNYVEDGKYIFHHNDDCKATTRETLMYLNQGGVAGTVTDPAKIKGISFELKITGADYDLNMSARLLQDYAYSYVGNYKAIDRKGNVVLEVDNQSKLDLTIDDAGNATYTAKPTLDNFRLPKDFDGIIILDFADGYVHSKGTNAGTAVQTFEQFYTAQKGVKGLGLYYSDTNWSAISTNAVFTYDNVRFVDDIDALIADYTSEEAEAKRVAAEEAEAEAAEKELLTGTHLVNDFTGANGNTTSISQGSRVGDVTYGFNDSADMMCGEFVYSAAEAKTDQRRVGMAVNQGKLDLSKAVGFTYDVNITNPDGFTAKWSHQGVNQEHGLTGHVYFINADTGVVTDMGEHFTTKEAVKGTVVFLFDPDVVVKMPTWGDKFEGNWPEYVEHWNGKISAVALWVLQDRATTTKTTTDESGNEVTETVLTDACANFKVQFDSLSFIYEENPIIEKIDYYLNNDVVFNNANNLSTISTPYSKYGIYETSVVALDEAPTGYAVYFDRVKDTYTEEVKNEETGEVTKEEKTPGSTTHTIKLGNSNLTQEKLAAMEAVSFWIKTPENTPKTFQPEFNSDGNYYKGVYILVDQNTGEVTYFDYDEKGASITVPGGFTGYVILPLKYAAFSKSWSHDPAIFTDYPTLAATTKLSQFAFYWSNAHTDWYMGEVKMIERLDEYMAELGIEQVSGDINGDNESDLRDLVRMKKFNADKRTTVAYQNLDIDKNGLVETATELIASRKQLMSVDYIAPEKDASLVEYPETMVGIYHSYYGAWNSQYADIIDESEIVNMYSTTDLYDLAQLKENGGYAWFYLHESFGGEPVFGNSTDGYDRAATEINEAYKTALDAKVQQLKKLGLWNTVVGFTDEEILIGDQNSGMTQAQFAIWTKYITETYGKRFNACLSTYEVNGNASNGTTAANAETYAYVTDIGYDWYTGTLEQHKTMFNNLVTNTGNRSDVKYWFYPTAYSGDGNDDDVLSGTPTRTDAACTEQIGIFAAMADVVPEGQLGGYYFYTWSDWSDSYGLESLIEDFDYTETCDALIKLATKYVG